MIKFDYISKLLNLLFIKKDVKKMNEFYYINKESYKILIKSVYEYIMLNPDLINSILKNDILFNEIFNDIFNKFKNEETKDSELEILFQDILYIFNDIDNSDEDTRLLKFKNYYCSERLFEHLDSLSDRETVQRAYNVIQSLDQWEYFCNFVPSKDTGYMYCEDEKIKTIMCKINEENDCHSGCSLAFTMRALKNVA